jgi:hypothetical protein
MKLTYTGKFAFNINGMTIHSTLAILFNKIQSIKQWIHDCLIKNNDQLHLLIIDKFSLVGNKIYHLLIIDYK